MAKSDKLSEPQQAMLDYIVEYLRKKKRPPTIREIMHGAVIKSTGDHISSTSVVSYHLKKLSEMGYLQREKKASRAMRVTSKAEALYGSVRSAVSGTSAAVSDAVDRLIRIQLKGDIVASEPVEVGHNDFAPYGDEDAIELSTSMISGRPESLYALRVRGDSMIDAMVNDGDIVIMQVTNEAKNGEMVAVWLNGDTTTLKYFYNEGSRVRLQPANPSMGPIYVSPADVQIQGRVMMVLRNTVDSRPAVSV